MVEIIGRLQRARGDNAVFLFGAINGAGTRAPMPLLTAAWQRAGLPPLRIDE